MRPLAGLSHSPQENFPLTCSSAGDKTKAGATATQRNEEAGLWGGEGARAAWMGALLQPPGFPKFPCTWEKQGMEENLIKRQR